MDKDVVKKEKYANTEVTIRGTFEFTIHHSGLNYYNQDERKHAITDTEDTFLEALVEKEGSDVLSFFGFEVRSKDVNPVD